MDGYEATSIIRNKMKMKDIPIIALSTDAMESTKEEVHKNGINAYATKPIDHKLLFDKIMFLSHKLYMAL